MIDPKEFYTKNYHPSSDTKGKMWKSISRRLFPSVITRTITFDRKSFVYGMAASFILMFTSIGIYSSFKQIVEVAQPQEIRADKAYQSAIHEFENVVLSKGFDGSAPGKNAYHTLQNKQLLLLNDAINELRQETNSHDLSPLKRQRLHELYNMKLSLLQEMIQQGELKL